MASSTTNMPAQKLSFAKIAAAGLNPRNIPARFSNPATVHKQAITSSARPGAPQRTLAAKPKSAESTVQADEVVPSSVSRSDESSQTVSASPEVQIDKGDNSPVKAEGASDTTGLLAPTAADDTTTVLSSSSGSARPPSLDGKSVASGTTFALDEKESLRPDDSASLVAGDDEDALITSAMPLPGPVVHSDDSLRAFRDQLREITQMEPPRHALPNQALGPAVQATKGFLYVPPPTLGIGSIPRGGDVFDLSSTVPGPPDPKLLEALDSPRDRLMVMKLQTDIIDFVNDAKEVSLILPQTNAYHRMLAHKAADYYLLGHVMDDSACGVRLFKTANTCLRPPLIGTTTPSTAASTPPPNAPQMKILRRGMDNGPAIVNGSNITSKTTSESGEGDDDDKKKAIMTREEREERYEKARLRIMGPAKSTDALEEQNPKDSSRSSSAAGKKGKKKPRSDSEDGFEARSAYGQFFPTSHTPSGFTPGTGPHSGLGHHFTPQHQAYPGYGSMGGFQQYPTTVQPGIVWPTPAPPTTNVPQQSYDLSAEFQRAISLQHNAMSPSSVTYPDSYPQPGYGGSPWAPANHAMVQQTSATGHGYFNAYGQYSIPQSSAQDAQPYQFGQLPSQHFPGRPASKLEHPLPGSYKGKHFDPQSQAFVPHQQTAAANQPSGTSTTGSSVINGSSIHELNVQAHRQPSAYGQGSVYNSPRQPFGLPMQAPSQSQPMLHPLPQPVFPRQASPNLPLPAKPGSALAGYGTTQQQQAITMMNGTPTSTGPSSISKWGAPASLPAKPPPPIEVIDANSHAQQHNRQAPYSSVTAGRNPGGSFQGLGSSPAFAVTNVSGAQRQ
ncbi:hypothetical protein LTR86_010785 [Recurvomyces mirabilis]|nr:hypothetical protein LTR86_010785 [Recurvomyces mirabilis]